MPKAAAARPPRRLLQRPTVRRRLAGTSEAIAYRDASWTRVALSRDALVVFIVQSSEMHDRSTIRPGCERRAWHDDLASANQPQEQRHAGEAAAKPRDGPKLRQRQQQIEGYQIA